MRKLWGLWSLKKDMSTRGNGRITREMGEEFSNGRTGPYIKDIGRIMWLTAMVDLYMLMETSI